jgi:hypothetical protein
MNNKKVAMFATENDTAQWAVLVSGYFQLVGTEEEADELLDKLVPNGDIESSPFGSCQILPPGYKPRFRPKYETTIDKISLHSQTDLIEHARLVSVDHKARIARLDAEAEKEQLLRRQDPEQYKNWLKRYDL